MIHERSSLISLVLSLQSLVHVADIHNWLVIIVVIVGAPVAHIHWDNVKLFLSEGAIKVNNSFDTFFIDNLYSFIIVPFKSVHCLSDFVDVFATQKPLWDSMLNFLSNSVPDDENVFPLVNVKILHEIRCHVEGMLCVLNELRWDIRYAPHHLPFAP